MSQTNITKQPLYKRPIWRCKDSQCKYFDKEETAQIKKPYPPKCPSCNSSIQDYCKKCQVFHNHHSFYQHCVKGRVRVTVKSQRTSLNAHKLAQNPLHRIVNTESSSESSEASSEESSDRESDQERISEPKCGMCFRPQVPIFSHPIQGCPNEDLLCMMCYPRWLATWAQRSANLTEPAPCPVCLKGEVKWNQAVEPFKFDYSVASVLLRRNNSVPILDHGRSFFK